VDVVEALAARELDVLVFNDLNMEAVTYLAAFSRVAHVQCLTLNNGITLGITGSTGMDFVISSALHQPPGAQAYYTEELLLLPGSHTYYIPEDDVQAGAPAAGTNGGSASGAGSHATQCPTCVLPQHSRGASENQALNRGGLVVMPSVLVQDSGGGGGDVVKPSHRRVVLSSSTRTGSRV
jgi:hypothetical protein